MDNGLVVRPRAGVHRTYALRDPVPVREAAETELAATRAVTSIDPHSGDRSDHRQHPPRPDHPAPEVVVDPLTRERIYRERDVRAAGLSRCDEAFERQRAYGRSATAAEAGADVAPRADIEA